MIMGTCLFHTVGGFVHIWYYVLWVVRFFKCWIGLLFGKEYSYVLDVCCNWNATLCLAYCDGQLKENCMENVCRNPTHAI